jgi:hypothetical protein
VGVALATSGHRKLQFGERTAPFAFPILFLLSSDGLLTGFYVANQSPTAAQV